MKKSLIAVATALLMAGCASKTPTGYTNPAYQNANINQHSVAVQSIDKTHVRVDLIERFRKDFELSNYDDVNRVMAKLLADRLNGFERQGSNAFANTILLNDSYYDDRPLTRQVAMPDGRSAKVTFAVPSTTQLAAFADKADVVLIINNVRFSDSATYRTKFEAPKPGANGGMVSSSKAVMAMKLDYLFYHVGDDKAVSYGRIVQHIPASANTTNSDWYRLMDQGASQILQQSPFGGQTSTD